MRLFFYFSVSLILHTLVLVRIFEIASFSRGIKSPPDSAQKIHVRFSPLSQSEALQARQGDTQPRPAKEKTITRETKPTHPENPIHFFLDTYHSRQQLTRQPQLAKNIDLSPLVSFFSAPEETVIIELYINDQGKIDKVDIATNNLSPEGIATLQELLSQLQFSAGEINGRTVKARIKIEVLLLQANQNKD